LAPDPFVTAEKPSHEIGASNLEQLAGTARSSNPPRHTPVLGSPETSDSDEPGRYAPARPAAIFSGEPTPKSIFGNATLSEQSLDDVILSYLSEELEEGEIDG
jgi:hypothetical protein